MAYFPAQDDLVNETSSPLRFPASLKPRNNSGVCTPSRDTETDICCCLSLLLLLPGIPAATQQGEMKMKCFYHLFLLLPTCQLEPEKERETKGRSRGEETCQSFLSFHEDERASLTCIPQSLASSLLQQLKGGVSRRKSLDFWNNIFGVSHSRQIKVSAGSPNDH